ncbi:MAG TPA: hypothetical protein VMA09_10520 [Candidatus Binataceae bacterium]|nr:hypothetical protein [Candidatus Binataceae bacterium]
MTRKPNWLCPVAISCAIALAGCGVARAPIDSTPKHVATPQQGQVSVSVQAQKPVGDVTPVYVSVANGTDDPRSLVPSQVFALDENGERVAPIPPLEAARQSGNARELESAVASSALSGAVAGGVGAALGAAAGSAFGAVGQGSIVGAASGAGWGMFRGAENGQTKADQQALMQIEALSLKPEEVRKNFTVSGYVFFPKGTYSQVEMLMINRETGDTESVREAWR